ERGHKMRPIKFFSIFFVSIFLCIAIPNTVEAKKGDTKKKWEQFKKSAKEKIDRTKRDSKKKLDESISRSRDKYDEWQRNKKQTRSSRERNENISEWKRKANEFSRQFGEQASREIINLRQKHGRQIGDDIERIYRQYGSKVGESVKKTYSEHGPKAGDFLRQSYDRRGLAFGDKIKKIYEIHGKQVGENLRDSFNKHGQRVGWELTNAIDRYGPKLASSMRDNYEKYGSGLGRSLESTFKIYAPRIKEAVRDEDNQKKIMNTISTVDAVYKSGGYYVKESTAIGLRHILQNVKVKSSDNEFVSLERYTQKWIVENAPYLEGTDIESDPAKAATYILLYQDVGYTYKELKVLKNGNGESVTMQEALYSTTNSKVDNVAEVLEIIDGFSELTNEDANIADIGATVSTLSKGIDIYNETNKIRQ
ncbi:hypothetical protein ACFL5K_03545, partial [Gemmatimonadota bacterium]